MSPPVHGWPPGAETTRPPPRSHLGAAAGDQRGTAGSPPPPLAPLSPPDPRTAQGRPGGRRPRTPPAGPGVTIPPPERAATLREGRHCRGMRCCTPRASSQPPTQSRITRSRPAALRWRARAPRGPQRDGGTRT